MTATDKKETTILLLSFKLKNLKFITLIPETSTTNKLPFFIGAN